MYFENLGRTRASPGPGECGCHLQLKWTWSFWSAPETTLDLVTVVPTWLHLALLTMVLITEKWHPVTVFHTWTSPGPGYSGLPLGLTRSWGHWSTTGPQQDLVNLLLT